jgi:flagellar motor switch protein FliN
MKTYLDCWIGVATALFSQALAGEPELAESLPRPLAAGSFGFRATISGGESGCFSVVLDAALLEAPLMGDGADQRAGWNELLREVADAACGELLAACGIKCHVEKFEESAGENSASQAFQLKSGDRAWTILVRDEVRAPKASKTETAKTATTAVATAEEPAVPPAAVNPGIELLLDVELDAALRFGCREMPLGEILEMGPGDVVQLDRHVSDPVDLIIGDKIVARGEVVLVNGNFGLRVTEVASPKKRLESIRCLF